MKIEDIAVDAISTLFTLDINNHQMAIKQAFKKWESRILSEEDALYFLNKVVSKRTEQHILFLLKEADPIFSKILDTIKYQMKKNGYIKIHHLGMSYIVKENVGNTNMNWIRVEDFRNLSAELFYDKNTLLKKLINYLATETNFVPAIPLNALVMKLKELMINSYIFKESEESIETQLDLDSVLILAYDETLDKLETSYKEKNKLSNEEIEIIKITLKDILNDLKDGGINPGLYKYIKVHHPSLSIEDYHSKYHNILEYLCKVMRNNLAEKLEFRVMRISE